MSGSKFLYGSSGSKTVSFDQVITNTLLLKKAATGTFNIDGILNVSSITNLKDKVYITGNVYIGNIDGIPGEQDFQHSFNVNSESFFVGDVTLVGNNYVTGNATLSNYVYYDVGQTHYLYGSPIGIGLNTISPQSTFDICGNIITTLNVKSNLPQNRNNIVQNQNNKGISVYTDDVKSSICFVNDSSLNTSTYTNIGDARVTYLQGSTLQLDVSNQSNRIQMIPTNTNLFSTVSITSRPGDVTSHVNNEQLVIYDISNGYYQYSAYKNAKIKTGSALSVISADNSSNTFLYATAPNRIGAGFGGGPYSMDTTRSMNTIGWTDISGNYTPTIHIVSNKDPIKYHSTLGLNTFKPRVDRFVLDVNGPTHLDNSEITMILDVSFEISIASSSRRIPSYISILNKSTYYTYLKKYNGTNNGYIIPAYPNPLLVNISTLESSLIPTSSDAGSTWIYRNSSLFNRTYNGDLLLYGQEESRFINVISIYVYDTNYTFMGLSSGQMNYTYDGMNWIRPNLFDNTGSFNTDPFIQIYVIFDTLNCYFYHIQSSGFGRVTMNNQSIDTSTINSFTIQPLRTTAQFSDLSNSTGMDGDLSKTCIFISTLQNIYKYTIFDSSFSSVCTGSYNCIKCFDANHVIAVGKQLISYTNDGINWNKIPILNVNFNSVYIYDLSNAIAVGNGLNGTNLGQIWITRNGYNHWIPIPDNILNSSGKSAVLYNCANLKSVTMTDLNTVILTNVVRPFVLSDISNDTLQSEQIAILNRGYSEIYNCYLPNLFNRVNNDILDICGNMTIAGDIHVDDEGEIITNNQIFNIINRNTPNLNLAGDATNIIIGNSYFGNTYIRHNLDISLNAKVHSTVESGNIFTGSTVISGGVGIFANTNIGGNLRVNSLVESFTKYDGSTAIAGGLGIFANTNIGGNLRVNSVVESGNIFTGSTVISGGVGIFANTNIGGNVRVNSVVESFTKSDGAVAIAGGLGIYANTNIGGNLRVNSVVESGNIFTGSTVISGGVGIFANTNIGGNVRVNSVVESFTKSDGAVAIAGGLGIYANTNIGGNLRVNSVVESGNIFTGSTVISGGVGIFANTNIGGNLRVNSVVESFTKSDGAVAIAGGLGIFANTNIGGNLRVNSVVESGNIFTGSTVISGGVGIFANTNIGGNVRVNSVVESYSKSDGAVAIAGGLGIYANTNIGGNLRVNSVVESFTKSDGAVAIAGGLGIFANTNIGGNLRVNSLVESNSILSGAVVISGGVGVYANLYVGGNINVPTIQTTTINASPPVNGNLYIGQMSDTIFLANALSNVNSTIVNLGGKRDVINVTGNLVITGNVIQKRPTLLSTPYILLNASNENGSSNGTSTNNYLDGAGVFIYDGSTTVPLATSDAAAFIKISADSFGFVFQGTSYIRNMNTYTYYPNPVKLNLRSANMSMGTSQYYGNIMSSGAVSSNNNNNSILVLQNPPSGVVDCSYQIVSSQFDLSSIVQRNVVNSNAGVQEIDTNITIMGTTLVNKGANYGIGISNAIMDVSGNVVVSKLGIGTNYVNGNMGSLDIAGNLYQMAGGYIIQF